MTECLDLHSEERGVEGAGGGDVADGEDDVIGVGVMVGMDILWRSVGGAWRRCQGQEWLEYGR